MNLDIIRPKDETEKLLLSITKNCETLIKQVRIQNHKKRLILSLSSQEKLSHLNHQYQLKVSGW